MKLINLYKTLAFTIILGFSTANISAQATQKIGGDSYNINPSAILELESTTKGFLLPRMTQVQMNAIPSPPSGMMVYCTDCGSGIGELRVRYTSSWGIPALNLSGDVNATVDASGSNVTTIGSAKVTYDKMQRVGANKVLGNGEDTDPSYVQEIATTGTGDVVRAISPALTGTPTAPTALATDSSTQIATTAFVKAVASSSNFVDLTTNQVVAGAKTFNDNLIVNGIKVGTGNSDNTNNTALGIATLSSNTGTYNTAIGESSLASNTTGFNNTAIGASSLVYNTTGQDNTAAGYRALSSNTTGTRNTATGLGALQAATTATQNTADGFLALNSNTTGINNAAFGAQSIQLNTVGSNNAASGYLSLSKNTSGDFNTAMGTKSLFESLTGSYNAALGNNALLSNTSGIGNSALGSGADVLSGDLTNATAIGYNSVVAASNTIQLGSTSVTNVKTSGTLTADAVTYPKAHGTSGQVLSTTGSGTLVWITASVIEVADEVTATAAQTSFTLTQTPSVNSIVKMYVNGIRISKTAFTVSGTTLTYIPANNGSYALSASDRIQFDYFK